MDPLGSIQEEDRPAVRDEGSPEEQQEEAGRGRRRGMLGFLLARSLLT
jgi:hypothetical protein